MKSQINLIKLLSLFVLVGGLVFVSSCSDDDADDPTPTPTATCTDGVQNGNETGVDCGGDCTACPTCDDGIQNGSETDVDCGGDDCPACPTCDDGIQNGNETGVDCGGDCDPCGSEISGEWKAVLFNTMGCNDDEDNVDLDLTNGDCIEVFPGIQGCIDIRFTFENNGNFTQITNLDVPDLSIMDSDTTSGTYTISGNAVTICTPDEGCETGTYSISGNTMELNYKDPASGCESDITAEKQ